MMIAVIIDARNPGSSGWVAVRHTRKIKVSGMNLGDQIRIAMEGDMVSIRDEIIEDCEVDILEDVDSVRAEILKVGEDSRISIDLE